MVTLSSSPEEAPTCPHGCYGGYLLAVANDTVTMCRCEVKRVVRAAMHDDVRAAKPTIEHAEWVQTHAKDLDRAVLVGAKADVLAVARCVHNALRVDQPGRFVVMTDRELVKMVTAGWREKDAEAESADQKIVRPHVLVLWLGALRDGPKASPEMVLDTIKLRRERRHATWLAYDPGRRCWLRELEAWTDVQEHLDAQYVRLEVPRVLGVSSTPKELTTAKDTISSPTAATSTSSPKSKSILTAKVKGRCSVCGEVIERGSEFRWADTEKNRAHPACMPST